MNVEIPVNGRSSFVETKTQKADGALSRGGMFPSLLGSSSRGWSTLQSVEVVTLFVDAKEVQLRIVKMDVLDGRKCPGVFGNHSSYNSNPSSQKFNNRIEVSAMRVEAKLDAVV